MSQLIGYTEPRIFTPPRCELTPETSHGFAAIAFAEQMLHMRLYPWQEWLLIHGLELNPDGTYRWRVVVVEVARQSGKTACLIVLALWHMYALKSRTVIGTAQDLASAEKVWKEAVALAQADEELAEMIPEDGVYLGHPKQFQIIHNEDGRELTSEYRLAAASRRGGRGFSGDLILMDELREHQSWDSWAAVTNDLDDNTPILTANGSWVRIADLTVGDRIFAPSGKPVTVAEVHPVAQLRPMYRVTSRDGRSVIASESHLWTVYDNRTGQAVERTLTTKQIMDAGLRGHNNCWRFRLPRQHALADLPERDLPIDPYILGVWLGDGAASQAVVHVGRSDADDMTDCLQRAGAVVKRHSYSYQATEVLQLRLHDRSLRGELAALGLLNNKHVPAEYLTASSEQRLALLQGLMDTDGCVRRTRDVSFSNTNESIADAALFLARSLGLSAYKDSFVPKFAKTSLASIQTDREYATCYTVRFMANGLNPFRLKRKAGALPVIETRQLLTSIVSIVPVDSVPSTCIAVDSEDRLFLAGRDLIPTHNTMNARPKAQCWAFSNAPDALGVVLRYLRALAHRELGWPDGDEDTQSEILGEIAALPEFEEMPEVEFDTGFFEWSMAPGLPRNDPDGLMHANPSCNHTEITENCITYRALISGLRTSPAHIAEAEICCRETTIGVGGPFPEGSWIATENADAAPSPESKIAVCVEVSNRRAHTFIARAGMNGEKAIVGIREDRAGTDWVIDYLKEHRKTFATVVVRTGSASPVSALLSDMRKAGLPVTEWKAAEIHAAHAQMFDRLRDGQIEHLPHGGLDMAATSAAERIQPGGGFIVDINKSPTDTAPLYAAIGAVWGTANLPPPPRIHAWDPEKVAEWEKQRH